LAAPDKGREARDDAPLRVLLGSVPLGRVHHVLLPLLLCFTPISIPLLLGSPLFNAAVPVIPLRVCTEAVRVDARAGGQRARHTTEH
jgi:hypothetical protein